MTVKTKAQLLARIPGTWNSGTNRGPQGMQFVETQLLTDLVDTLFSGPNGAKARVRLTTAAALPAYTRTGAVLLANANGALGNIDGVAAAVGDRVCLKNGAAGVDNGLFVIDSLGGAGKWQMTRSADLPIGAHAAGIIFACELGTANADLVFLCTSDEAADLVGTDAIAFGQLAATTDHGALAGLADDDHTQYSRTDGTRALTGVQAGVNATGSTHLTTKSQIDTKPAKQAVRAMTVGALPAYTRTGINTLAETVAAAGFPVLDGAVVLTVGQRFYLANGGAGLDNGIWEVTVLGDAVTPFECARVQDWTAGMHVGGASFFVTEGATMAGLEFTCTNALATDVVNTDAPTLVRQPGASLPDGSRAFTAAVNGVAGTVAAALATKGQVDAKPWKGYVAAVTAGALAAYTRAADVITADAVGAIGAIDGVAVVQGDKILLKNGAAGVDNGVYVITTLGDGATAFVLTRDQDLAAGMVATGAAVFCPAGTANADRVWVCPEAPAAAVINADAITFVAAHGTLAAANALHHDTGQVENTSTVAGATLTLALQTLGTAAALGATPREVVRLATIAALPAYTRLVDVITADANGVIADIDGEAPVLLDYVLLQHGAAGVDDGVYQVTTLGDGGTAFVLTRRADFSDADNVAGFWVEATAGGTQAGHRFIVSAAPAVVNTNALAFLHFSG